MKPCNTFKFVILFFLTVISYITAAAHEINKYKYFCLDIKDNPYGIEKKILNKFQEYGFSIMDKSFYNTLDTKEKALVLFADYDYMIVNNGYSPLTLRLKTASGNVVWSHTGRGGSLTAKGDMNGACKQIFKAFEALNYKFDPSLASSQKLDHKFANWTQDSIRIYLRNKPLSSLEGIYKDYQNNGNGYSVAILRDKDTYYGIILNADNGLWEKGEAKMILNPIERNLYDTEYYDSDHQKLNSLATLKNNRILEINVPNAGTVSFLKTYPSGDTESGGNESISTDQCVATGSGILISDNYIITNHHVIEEANKIEVVFNINGETETYNAKLLCSDKTNDLAIITIKDEKFKGLPTPPFQILSSTEDVGTSIFTMGFPLTNLLGEELKITDGIINSKTGFEGDVVTYQISAPIQPGSSGGPLFNKKGNLVGITNAGVNREIADNVNYAIKTNYVLNLIDSAPVIINLPKGKDLANKELSELVKILRPYVAFIKIY